MLFTCLTLKKKLRLAVARMMGQWVKSRSKDFLFPTALHPSSFPKRRARKQTRAGRVELWRVTSYFFRVWIPGGWSAATLWPSGYFWKDSRNFFKSDDFAAKDPDKKSFLDLEAGCRSQECIIWRPWTFWLALKSLA